MSGQKAYSKKLKFRMIRCTLWLLIFTAMVLSIVVVEMQTHEMELIDESGQHQVRLLKQLSDTISLMVKDGSSEGELVTYLDELGTINGSFFVLSRGNEVIFAKNKINTNGLVQLRDKSKFFASIKKQNVLDRSESFSVKGEAYQIHSIADPYALKTQLGITKHKYNVEILVVLICLIMIVVIELIVSNLNKYRLQLFIINEELEDRNSDVQVLSEELDKEEGEKEGFSDSSAGNGIIREGIYSFYNAATMNMLLDKSAKNVTMSLYMIVLKVSMTDRYYSKQELFAAMDKIKKSLKRNEVMGELVKGKFLICMYRWEKKQARERYQDIVQVCKDIKQDTKINIVVQWIDVPEDYQGMNLKQLIP